MNMKSFMFGIAAIALLAVATPAKADPSPIDTAPSSNSNKQEESYEGMEDWEIELRKAAI